MTFKPVQVRVMLHRNCMVVARTRVEGTWKAYCFPVPGLDHDEEEYLWEKEGSQISEKIARTLFGRFKEVPYAK